MPFELKVIAEPGSATLCGECSLRLRTFDGTECVAFQGRLELDVLPGSLALRYKRLPECVEAERRAQEGACPTTSA
jgi:hypothetical protein